MQVVRLECALVVNPGRWTRHTASRKTNHRLAVWFRAGICNFGYSLHKNLSRNAASIASNPVPYARMGGGHRQIDYWVGRMLCVKPIVLMARSMGVNGGSRLGVRKSVS